MKLFEIQKAVYTTLANDTAIKKKVKGVYDDVPQDEKYPYIVIGDDTINKWDTDTELGLNTTLTIHAWSRKAGKKEIKEVMGLIYNALHRAEININNMNLVTCECEFMETFTDSDRITRRGVQRYRIIVEVL